MIGTIHKYPLHGSSLQKVALPSGAQLLTVQVQGDEPMLWALVYPNVRGVEVRSIRVYGTGHPIDVEPVRLRYIATFQLHGGALVFHVFEETP